LSDYEALQAECEKLRAAMIEAKGHISHYMYGGSSYREPAAEAIALIDDALQEAADDNRSLHRRPRCRRAEGPKQGASPASEAADGGAGVAADSAGELASGHGGSGRRRVSWRHAGARRADPR